MSRSMMDRISAQVAGEMYDMVRSPGHNLSYPHYWGSQDKCEHCGKTFQQVLVKDAQDKINEIKSEIRYQQTFLVKAKAELKKLKENPVR